MVDTAGVIGLIPPLVATKVVKDVAMASVKPKKRKKKRRKKK